MYESAHDIKEIFRRLLEEKETAETPKLLENAIQHLQRLNKEQIISTDIPIELVNQIPKQDESNRALLLGMEQHFLSLLHQQSKERQRLLARRKKQAALL